MKEQRKSLEKKWIWRAVAFGIPLIVSVIICAANGIYPFGNNCILHIDMYHQYCPFFMEFREKLTEGRSLLYSWNLGLGSDFIALYAYYLASPMNWLLILCPKGLVIEFMTFTTWVKIALAGMFFYCYLEERFQLGGKEYNYRISTSAPAIVFSTAYAFSGFVATYSWNIMWMDSIALAPLIMMGLERLVKRNRPMVYYVSLALSILSNYYISIMICLFLVLYFAVLLCEQKKDKIIACVRFAWYSLLAGGTAAVILIPEIIMLGYTASADSGFPKEMKWYFGFIEELSRLCTTTAPYTGLDHWPNIYCGTFTVLLVLLYVFNNRIKWTQKVPRVLLLVFMLVSFSNNILNYIWHGLHFPNSLPARQSFLFIFLMLAMGYETYRQRKGNKIWQVMISVLLCIVILVLGSQRVEPDVIEPTSFVVTGVFLVAYMLCFILHEIGSKEMRMIIKGLALGIAIGEIILNMALTGFYALNRDAYLQKMADYDVLLELAEHDAAIDAADGTKTFYRVEDTERKTKNDDSLYGYPSGTIFSSLTNIAVSHFYQSVYMEGGKNFYSFNGATPLLSSMFSVKYMLSDHAEGENDLREIIGNSGGYYLYENKYCLPLGFMMSEEAITNWDNTTGDKLYQINSLGHVLGANGNMLVEVNPAMVVEEGITTITMPDDGIYYAYYDKCSADSLTIRMNDGPGTRYSKTTHRYLFEFGQCVSGDTITVTNSKQDYVSFHLLKLNLDMVNLAYNTLNEQTMVLEEYTDTYLKGQIEVTEAGRLIFSIPIEEGWRVFVDGEEMETLDFKETFLSVHLEEGVHSVELKYMTPGLGMGCIISGISIGLFAFTIWLRKVKNAKMSMPMDRL